MTIVRVYAEAVIKRATKLRIHAQGGPTEWGGTEPSEWGNLIDPSIVPPKKQKLVDAPNPEQLQTSRQRNVQIKKLLQLIDEIFPLAEQEGPKADEAKKLIQHLSDQVKNIKQMDQVGSDYYSWLQEQPSQLNPKEWGPGTRWRTPEEIPTGGTDVPRWEEGSPAAPQPTVEEAPKFPPARQAPKPKMQETAPQQPTDLSQEQSDIDQGALQIKQQQELEQIALELDRFLESADAQAGTLLEALSAATDDQITDDFKKDLSRLVNFLDEGIATAQPLAEALIAQIEGSGVPQELSPEPLEDVDTSDFEQFLPDELQQ